MRGDAMILQRLPAMPRGLRPVFQRADLHAAKRAAMHLGCPDLRPGQAMAATQSPPHGAGIAGIRIGADLQVDMSAGPLAMGPHAALGSSFGVIRIDGTHVHMRGACRPYAQAHGSGL